VSVDFGDKVFKGVGFPTPFSLPDETTCRTLEIPASGDWQAVVMGALLALVYPENWQQFEGGITRDEAADRALDMVWDLYDNLQCGGTTIAPYWDDEDGDDATGEPEIEDFPWYENLADFAVTAFLAVSFSPGAAVRFVTIARKIRLAFRSRDYGAILKIFIDGDEVGEVDTYSPEPGLAYFDYEIPETMMLLDDPPSWLLRIEHTGTHNESATPTTSGYGMEVIRKNIRWSEDTVTIFRQNPEDACQLEQSVDNGETWTLAFDYALCSSPTGVPDTIIVNPGAPDTTFTHQEGENDTQTQARNDALCYAARKTVQTMMRAAADVCNNQVDAINIGSIVTVIVGAVLVAVTIISATSLTALGLVIAAALLQLFAQVQENSCELYTDEDIEDGLTCMMYLNLQNRAVTLEDFRHAFDFETGCESTDTEAVATVFQSMLQSLSFGQRLFDGFLNVLGEAQSAALQGATIESCICAAATWCYIFDFATVQPMFEIITGEYVSGAISANGDIDNWGGNDCIYPTPSRGVQIRINVFLATGVSITTITGTGTNPGNPTAWMNLFDGTTCLGQASISGATFSYNYPGADITAGNHVLTFGLDNNTGGAQENTLETLTFSGTGNNPFAACDNC